MNLFKADTYKTISGFSATQLVKYAKVYSTHAGTFFISADIIDYELVLTDNDMLSVSGFGFCICVMYLDDNEIEKMATLEALVESKYLAA